MSQQQIQRRKNMKLKRYHKERKHVYWTHLMSLVWKTCNWRGIGSHLLLNIFIFYESDEILQANSHARTHVHINNSIPFQCFVTKQLLPEWLTLIYGEDFLRSCLLFNLFMFSIKVMRFFTPTHMHTRTHGCTHQ